MTTANPERRSPIIPGQLLAARQSIGLSLEEAAKHVQVEPEELARWEKGVAEPSVEQLWELAELYGRATDYFLKRLPPPPARVSFRLRNQRTMRDLPLETRKVLARFQELCRAADDLEELSGTPRVVTVTPVPKEDDPDRLAQRERERLGLGNRPIRDLRALLEKQGVRIFEIPVRGEGFSGFSWWHSDYGPCILVNAGEEAGRRTFTLAHEYAHLLQAHLPHVCHPEALIDKADERFANRFAVAFLMPASDVVNTFKSKGLSGTSLSTPQLASLARRYGVSLHAMAIRLEELGLVAKRTTQSLIAQWEASPKFPRRPKTAPWKRRLGESYVSLASRAYAQGQISVGKLAEYLGRPLREAIAIAQEAKQQGHERG